MKTNIMQKMASKYKKIQFILIGVFVSIALFGCITNSPKKNEEVSVQPQKIEEPAKKESSDVVEGLVPPTNQNILMPYYVQAGDKLSKIAKKIYGNSHSWKKIAELNHIVDPNKIYAGDVIYYEVTDKSKEFAETYENAPRAKIIVKRGDTLSQISKIVFGKSKDWRVLWKENPQIQNPDRIKVGTAVYFRPKALTAEAGSYKDDEKEKEDRILPTAENEKLNENNDDLSNKNENDQSAIKEKEQDGNKTSNQESKVTDQAKSTSDQVKSTTDQAKSTSDQVKSTSDQAAKTSEQVKSSTDSLSNASGESKSGPNLKDSTKTNDIVPSSIFK